MSVFNLPFLDLLKKAIENIIQTSNTVTISTTFNNGDDKTAVFTFTSTSKAKLEGQVDLAAYIDSVASNNSFINGANFNPSQWIVIGPFYDLDATDGKNVIYKLRIKNVSAGSHTVVVKAVIRAIQNSITSGGSGA